MKAIRVRRNLRGSWTTALLVLVLVSFGVAQSPAAESERTAPTTDTILASPVAADSLSSMPASPPAILRVNEALVDQPTFDWGLTEYLREKNILTTDTAAQQNYLQSLIDRLCIETYARETRIDREAEFRRRLLDVRRRLLFDYVIQREVTSRIEITTDSVAQYYESHKSEFTEPEKIQVRHILTATRAEAEKARGRILAGEEFSKVAAGVSTHGSKAQGGLLPLFTRGTYQPEFEKVAFAMKVGELSGPVKTDLGFHIIEKTAERPARVRPLDEVAAQIRKSLHERERRKKTAEFLANIRRQARIEVGKVTVDP